MKKILILLWLILPSILFCQHSITIDGDFADWLDVPVAVEDPADDVHDTDWFSDGLPEPMPREYSDVDILQVKFTNDAENLYGYIKATGQIGRTSSDTLGHAKRGRYYFIFTIDVDDNDSTGYRLAEGNYWPDSRGYDMNMEVEFYNGGFNTGHYINHEFLSEEQLLTQGKQDLADGIVRLAPGTYDWYTQWVMFEDSTYIEVEDKGEVYQGIITIAVSPDSYEAEIKAPLWGFLRTPEGQPIIDVGQYIVVSASLEGSGELSEESEDPTGGTSVWGSDTAEPFRYYVADPATPIADNTPESEIPSKPLLRQNYPNPFNSNTIIDYELRITNYVELSVYNLLGQKMTTLVNGKQKAGFHTVEWDAGSLASGIYYYRLQAEGFVQTKKLILLR